MRKTPRGTVREEAIDFFPNLSNAREKKKKRDPEILKTRRIQCLTVRSPKKINVEKKEKMRIVE